MKIVEETQNTLVLKDDASKAFVMGGLTTFIALCVIVFSVYAGIHNQAAPNGSSLLFFGIVGFILLAGIATLLFARVRKTAFDKSQDSFQLVATGVLGTQITEKKISDIARIELRTKYINGGRGGPHENYRLALVSKDASELFLDSVHDQKISVTSLAVNASGMAGMGRERELGQKIASFIGVEFLDGDPSNAGVLSHVGNILQ